MNRIILWCSIVLTIATACVSNSTKPANKSEGDFSNTLTDEEIKGARLTPEILWKFGRISEMQLSPNGKTIIYNVSRYDVKTNKKLTAIYAVPVEGGEAKNLTPDMPSCYNPRWINDKRIAFMSVKDDVMQIWVMSADGSAKTAVSSFKKDISGFEVSGNGEKIFYLQDVKLDSTTQDKYPDLDLAKGRVIDDLMYRHWDSWSDYSYSHIFITDLKPNEIKEGKDIMKDEPYDSPLSPYFEINEIAWSYNGKMLAYSCKKLRGKEYAESTNSDVYLYDVEKDSTFNITEGMPGYDRYPVFSPDGKKLAFQSMARPGNESDKRRLFVYDLQTKSKVELTTTFDQDASDYQWASDSKTIFFISGINATYQLYSVNIETNEIKTITKGVHDYTAFAYKNSVLVGTKMSMSMASEIFKVDPVTGAETQITFTNKNIYDAVKFGQVRERWVKTTDNKKMLVWVIYPPDFDSTKRYPALLYCQGGPQSAVSQFFSYRWNFQMMAANNYIIVAPNRRGLPTFGQEWNDQISGDYGGQNIKDYLSAIDELKKEPYIDNSRLGAVGASYGGFSVFYLAGVHQNRFKAFISHCGMYNLESQAASTEEFFFTKHDLGGYPWDNPKSKSFTQFSPHLNVDKWNTPIMIITGANDFRIPYTESLQAFNAAQLRGVPSKLLFFPDENHWITKPQNSILWQREFFKWLDKWLK
jgi:dipeptidyl aminopeptidase/acylaminoacyl peptidase